MHFVDFTVFAAFTTLSYVSVAEDVAGQVPVATQLLYFPSPGLQKGALFVDVESEIQLKLYKATVLDQDGWKDCNSTSECDFCLITNSASNCMCGDATPLAELNGTIQRHGNMATEFSWNAISLNGNDYGKMIIAPAPGGREGLVAYNNNYDHPVIDLGNFCVPKNVTDDLMLMD